jgi:hypothetical protein
MATTPEYPKVGDKELGQGQDCYVLEIWDFVDRLKPPKGLGLEPLDPARYFITSGDAVMKTVQLARDMWSYAGRVRKVLNQHPMHPFLIDFEKLCWNYAGKANIMKAALERARGDAVFLECEWDDGKLLVIPKNPRSRMQQLALEAKEEK